MEEDPLGGHPVLRSLRTLGHSGNHLVVLATNLSTGQLVAVKLIPRGFDSAQAKYLLRGLLNHYELTLAKHPHIVGLLDCFLTPRYLAIVMEYVDGENLQVFVEKAGGCIIESLARFLFQQLIIAMDFCQRRGKVNRNIRPSSLLLQLSDSALPLLRLVDFSASKDTLRNSEPRSQVGTAMYCAPEVLQNFRGAPYDAAAADVWSAGVVLFVALFGRHPFSRPEDTQLPAQQQILAMFKRLTAPPGCLDGDLFVPHVLPTASLPGAQPGAPLSLAGADLLRGMLARDPRVRLTLDGVQRHEWFQTNLPEGAALLNEVVAAEEAAAGAAAVMPAAVAAQLERMIVLAAAGPAAAPPPMEVHGCGGGGGGGGPGESGGGGGGGGGGGKGGGMRPVRDSSVGGGGGGGAIINAPTMPQSAYQAPAPQQHPPPAQAQVFVRTVTTVGAYDAVVQQQQQQSVSIGSAVASQQQSGYSGSDCAVAGGGAAGAAAAAATSSSTGAVTAAACTRTEAHWPAVAGRASGGGVAAAAAAGGDGLNGGDALLADLEAMVMSLPEDDLPFAASLDLFSCPTPRPQPQQQFQNQQQQQQQQLLLPHSFNPHPHHHHQLQPSGAASGVPPPAPLSNDTVCGRYPGPSPPQQPTPSHSAPTAAAASLQLPPYRASDADAVAVPYATRRSGGGAPEAQGRPTSCSAAAAADLTETTPHHPAAAAHTPKPLNNTHPALYVSLHSAAEEAAAAAADGSGGGGLLMRLRTDSLPSPGTLAVVDTQPFLANGSGGSGSGPAGGGSGGGLFSGLLGGSSFLHQLRENSQLGAMPSTYSMDWCTLSARSEALLSPRPPVAGGGAATGSGPGGEPPPPPPPGGGCSLVQSSLFHRLCHEAKGAVAGVAAEVRDLGRAAVAGLAPTRRS
ncbi:hypothetical protein PLESTM_001293300 [Pleodorina starrii]|nr:hypothetical protein PLESTM_001293300 [Pleodorina starrii]